MKNLERKNLRKKETKLLPEKGLHSDIKLSITVSRGNIVTMQLSGNSSSPSLMRNFQTMMELLLDSKALMSKLQEIIVNSELDNVSQGAMLIFLDKILEQLNEQPVVSPEQVFST